MYHKSVNVRLLALNWFEALDAEPDIYMLTYLPRFLNSLFMMLIDSAPALRNQAQITMHDLSDEIELYLKKNVNEIAQEEQFDIENIVNNLVQIITSSDKDLQLRQQMIFGNNGKNDSNGHDVMNSTGIDPEILKMIENDTITTQKKTTNGFVTLYFDYACSFGCFLNCIVFYFFVCAKITDMRLFSS